MSDLELPEVEPSTPLGKADVAVAEALLPYEDNPFVRALRKAGDLTDQEPLYGASGAVIATGIVMRDMHVLRAGTRILASHLLATALRGVLKRMVDRTRPEAAARRGEYELGEGERFESDFNSFPSGHAAGAAAVAYAVGREWPGAQSAAFGLAAAATAAPVLGSKHFVSDVVAGAAIGVIAASAVDLLMSWAEER